MAAGGALSDSVGPALERTYDVSGDDLAGQLTEVAGKLAEEYWTEHQQDFFYIVDGSFLEEYDEYNIGVQFKVAATVSITYALMSRCGLEPERYFDHEDFMAIFDFNTPSTIGALGTAVSQINQQVLRQIGVTVRNAEREANQERSKQDEQSHDLYPERRLSDSRPEAEPAAGETLGQVRKDEENLPEGTPSHPLQPDVAEREAVPAPSGDRRDRPEQTGADDAPAGEGSGSHRATPVYRITYEECVQMVGQMKDSFETDVFGVEKEDGKVQGIIAAVYQSVFGQDAYPSLEEKAANLLYFMIKDHPYADGCKRIAASLFLEFLDKNNALFLDGEKRLSDGTLVAITLMIAESKSEEKDVMVKLVMNLLKL